MSSGIFSLTLATALGSGLVGGMFFAFSTFVMPALGALPASQGIAAMQSINVKVINAWFMTAFLGTAGTSVAAVVVATVNWGSAYAPYLLAGAVLYLVGVIGVTMLANVPRNDALAAAEPTASRSADQWRRYLIEWTNWNTVRTIAPLVAAALEIGALHVA